LLAAVDLWKYVFLKFLMVAEGPQVLADVEHLRAHKVSAAAVVGAEVRM
jgi:hypothetical protein